MKLYEYSLLTLVGLTGCGVSHAPLTTTTKAIELSWNETNNTDPAVKFNIYREDGSSGFNKINSVTADWYIDSDVTTGVTYTYEIKAADASGKESEPSDPVTALIP